MPLYEFRCGLCGGRRDVWASLAQVSTLELICLVCGGTMRKQLSSSVAVIAAGTPSPPGPGTSPRPRPRSAGRSCSHAAVNLKRPNPFRNQLPGGAGGDG